MDFKIILFCTVVALEEEKFHLKHFFRQVEGQGHRGQIKVKMVICLAVCPSIPPPPKKKNFFFRFGYFIKKNSLSLASCTVVALEEEKCHLKHCFRQVEGQGHRGQNSRLFVHLSPPPRPPPPPPKKKKYFFLDLDSL